MVAAAMTVAQRDNRQQPLDRMQSNAVWGLLVFVLNVLAFLFVGLEARGIVHGLDADHLRQDLTFAALVVGIVIGVRIILVMLYNRAMQPLIRRFRLGRPPSIKQGIVASWCGMRGMVTLAAALALPQDFPRRDLVVLSALAVVLGTLVIQGITLEPLIRLLRFPDDASHENEKARVRAVLTHSAMNSLQERDDSPAAALRQELQLEMIDHQAPGRIVGGVDSLRLEAIRLQRQVLQGMRRQCEIEEEVFRDLEQELDLHELASTRKLQLELINN
jgi:CPA1 family monovalent cation:H+ antiporter